MKTQISGNVSVGSKKRRFNFFLFFRKSLTFAATLLRCNFWMSLKKN